MTLLNTIKEIELYFSNLDATSLSNTQLVFEKMIAEQLAIIERTSRKIEHVI
jgi:hypothetical protein